MFATTAIKKFCNLKKIHGILPISGMAAMNLLFEIDPPSSLINHGLTAARRRGSSAPLSIPPRATVFAVVCLLWLVTPALSSHAQNAASARSPLGIYVHVDVPDVIKLYGGPLQDQGCAQTAPDLHTYLRCFYAKLLADSAISGIAAGLHWDQIQLDDPLCALNHSCTVSPDGYDWSYVDDIFAEANAAHKTVQLIVTPGTDSPTWLLNLIPSCDGLFTGSGTAPRNCGKATFLNFPEVKRADGNPPVLPLPWDPIYLLAWDNFLVFLNARYNSNPSFVSISIAGPMCASNEMILPTTGNGSTQASGLPADQAWQMLIHHSFPLRSGYENSDQVFIDAGKQAIDAYEAIFSGITIFSNPDAANDFPEQPYPFVVHPDNTLYAVDCSTDTGEQMSCEAKTEILSYFVAVNGRNKKATQVGGMTAGSNINTGDIGVSGIKLLTSLTHSSRPPILGGAEFDLAVSNPSMIQQQGCPNYSPKNPNPDDCKYLTPEQAAYNTFTVFFDATPVAADFGGSSSIPPIENAPIQYVEVDFQDLQYAQDPANACQTYLPTMTKAPPSLQDYYNLASYDLYAMAGKLETLPPTTCNNP